MCQRDCYSFSEVLGHVGQTQLVIDGFFRDVVLELLVK